MDCVFLKSVDNDFPAQNPTLDPPGSTFVGAISPRENSSWAICNSAERLPPAAFRKLGPAELQDVNDFCWLKRLFVYSADTQFDTRNTSNDSASFGGAGAGVIFGLVSFACGGPRFDSLGVSLLFSGRGPAFQKNMVASNVTRWLRPRPGSGSGTNTQERFSNCKYIERVRHVVNDQEGRAVGKREA
jgi:hypothetical protein